MAQSIRYNKVIIMSTRVLRKLQGDKELNEEISDPDNDLPIGGARRKQLNVNRYDLVIIIVI